MIHPANNAVISQPQAPCIAMKKIDGWSCLSVLTFSPSEVTLMLCCPGRLANILTSTQP